MRGRTTGWVLAVLLCTSAAEAAGGRIEISQAAVEAAGGFPFVIAEPGNYVLTSDLVVTEDVDAISVAASAHTVTIDLAGFRIDGPYVCGAGNCPAGAASGIALGAGFNFSAATVFGGDVIGFSGDCIQVSTDSRVTEMRVRNCGRNGISAGLRAFVQRNTVRSTGENGIRLFEFDGGVYAHNTVSFSGLGGGGHRAIVGGQATGGNVCADGSCSARGIRRFYMTDSGHNGAQARSGCEAGFHMASMWEILDPAQLEYDLVRGRTRPDAGAGALSGSFAWIRTGHIPDDAGPAGMANCDAYTESGPGTKGTIAKLASDWNTLGAADASRLPWWETRTTDCQVSFPVWCVED